MRNTVLFGGSSNPELAKAMAHRLGIPVGGVTLSKFKNNETNVEIHESVRDQDVFIVQSGCGHVNDTFMELLIMIRTCRISSARKITAVIPCFPYARQPDRVFNKKGETSGRILFTEEQKEMLHKMEGQGYKHWLARSGKLVANLLVASGADHIITMDLHDAQFQGFFDIPVENLYGQPIMIKWIRENVPNWSESIVVSPDAGGAKRATSVADAMGLEFALIHSKSDVVDDMSMLQLVGNVNHKQCIIIDDMADTCHTIATASSILKAGGATKIYALVTHGIYSGEAVERVNKSDIDLIVASNTVPQVVDGEKFGSFDVAPIFAEAVRRTHNGESVSFLFNVVPI